MTEVARSNYQQVLVGVDGSPTAGAASDRAIAEAAAHGAHLHLVDVVNVPDVAGAPIGAAGAAALLANVAARDGQADAALTRTHERASAAGVQVTAHLVHGDPGSAIVDIAKSVGADLIVVGSRGLDSAGRYILGSVPDKVLHLANCDVLVVRTT